MISICIIGAGNVATHLYKAFTQSNQLQVKQWYNRDLSKISTYKNEVAITNTLDDLVEADVYLMAISDDAIKQVSSNLPFENRLVVHTSGSAGIHDLDKKLRRGVFYPLQTFSKGVDMDFKQVPICIETIDKQDIDILKTITEAIGSKWYRINTEQRQTLHLSAVFVNNFTNQLYRIAHEISDAKSIDFDILKPLIMETAKKVQTVSPYMAQTGPAVRHDKKTIKRHLKQLENSKHKDIYELLTASIKNTHGR
ncbi:Rossmann-like and DUF2520 domain-containing protein [Mangrovimonas spongiae]|uniref:DUF2520 domain-containing protein n=1 Tax=Mangrovimonas spongiae TaxID=2494697 RepID=A0A428K1Z5_9FLAO|nr:DUF2520 domain-containing protein [Mangrovimonas spongiae]RSK40376.1 DUF2520 domain-containing protein [Mangrovimonas spongiae]